MAGWFRKGFNNRSSGGGGAVTAAAVLAALVGGAIVAASLSTTGDADIGGILRLNENADPSGVGDECRLFALDDDTLQAECGAAGPTTTLVDENGDMSVANQLTVADDIFMTQGTGRLVLDDDEDTEIIANIDDSIQFNTGGTQRGYFNNSRFYNATAELLTEGVIRASGIDKGITSTGNLNPKMGAELDTTGGAFTRTLPTAVAGYIMAITCIECTAGATIAPASGDAIAGAGTSLVIDTDGGAVLLFAIDATTWYVIGGQGYTATP